MLIYCLLHSIVALLLTTRTFLLLPARRLRLRRRRCGLVELVGFVLWVFVRFVVGLPMMYLYFTDAYAMFTAGRASPKWLYAWYVSASAMLQIMNVIWLMAILKSLFPSAKKKAARAKKAD